MRIRKVRQVERDNQAVAGILSEKGTLENLSRYLVDSSGVRNVLISGGNSSQRVAALYPTITRCMSAAPVIVLHNQDAGLERALVACSRELLRLGVDAPVTLANSDVPVFEPFLDMQPEQVLSAVRRVACVASYKPGPRLQRIVDAHISILNRIETPVSLTGFQYLCSFSNMETFHDNVMALPGSFESKQRLWADLGVDTEDFDLFRSVISLLTYNAGQCGWDKNKTIADSNCLKSLQIGGPSAYALSMSDACSDVMLPYLSEELISSPVPFLLVVDGIRVNDERFFNLLRQQCSSSRLAVIGENAASLITAKEDGFQQVLEKMGTLVMFKHGTDGAARKLADAIGQYDAVQVSQTHGTGKGYFSILPHNRHKEFQQGIERRYRVQPEELISLRPNQAIVFDISTNQIIHFK